MFLGILPSCRRCHSASRIHRDAYHSLPALARSRPFLHCTELCRNHLSERNTRTHWRNTSTGTRQDLVALPRSYSPSEARAGDHLTRILPRETSPDVDPPTRPDEENVPEPKSSCTSVRAGILSVLSSEPAIIEPLALVSAGSGSSGVQLACAPSRHVLGRCLLTTWRVRRLAL